VNPSLQALLGSLAVAGLLGGVVLVLVVPRFGPWLVEVCRGEERGRFWKRTLAVSLALALPLGVFLGYVFGPRYLYLRAGLEEGDAVLASAAMLRQSLELAALVFGAAMLGTLVVASRAGTSSG